MKYPLFQEVHNNLTAVLSALAVLLLFVLVVATPSSSFAQDDENGSANLLEVRADPPGIPKRPVPFGLGEKIVMHV
jgi:hypothetical protein